MSSYVIEIAVKIRTGFNSNEIYLKNISFLRLHTQNVKVCTHEIIIRARNSVRTMPSKQYDRY